MCEFLVSRGRRRLAVISADDPPATTRQQSFSRTAAKLGVAPPHVEFVAAPASHASGRLAISNTLERQPEIDAVFCSSDMLAMGVMTELRARTIPVPESIAVVGFGDLDFSATLVPTLTTVR